MLPKKRGPRVTVQQIEYLVNFVCEKENTSILTMKTTPCKEAELKKMWEKAAIELNRMNGPFKQSEDWRRFFVEFKSKLRAKARAFKVAQQKTGGGTNDAKPLTEIEEKLMSHIGWVSITGCNDVPDELDPSTNNNYVLHNYDNIELGNVVEMDKVELCPVNLEEWESAEIIQVEQVQREEGKNKAMQIVSLLQFYYIITLFIFIVSLVQVPSDRRQDIKASEGVQRELLNKSGTLTLYNTNCAPNVH